MSRSAKDRRHSWMFVAPAAAVLFLMLLFPFAYTAYLSFFEWFAAGPPPRFNGGHNYVALLSDALRRAKKPLGVTVSEALSGTAPHIRGLALSWMAHADLQLELL